MANNELAQSINKQTMLQYLSDVQRIEDDIYTLKMTFHNAIRSHKKISDYWLEGGIEKHNEEIAQKVLRPTEQSLYHLREDMKAYGIRTNKERENLQIRIKVQAVEAEKKFRIGNLLGGLGVAVFLTPPIFGVLIAIILVPLFFMGIEFNLPSELVYVILGLPIFLIAAIITTIATLIIRKTKNDDEAQKLSKLQKELAELESEYKKQMDAFGQKEQSLMASGKETKQKIADNLETKKQMQVEIHHAFGKLHPHLDEIKAQIENLEKQRDTIYGMNVLPPDYRSLECVMALHQIFRNDLADTMRDAILLYEERLFRGEMIRGLDNIAKSIDQLGRHMQETVTQLKKMNVTAERMGKNLVDIAYDIQEGNAQAANISEKIESQSFINESIKTNTERLAWYEEQRRLGLF